LEKSPIGGLAGPGHLMEVVGVTFRGVARVLAVLAPAATLIALVTGIPSAARSKTFQGSGFLRRGASRFHLLEASAQAPAPATSTIVALNVAGIINYVGPTQEGFRVGGHEKLRIVYDEAEIDPKTHHVKLLNMQHFINGHYEPAHPDARFMPMNDAWIDLSSQPYRYHYVASVFHGRAIIIIADENTRMISIRAADQVNKPVLMRERYTVDPTPIRGKEAIEAGTPAPPGADTRERGSILAVTGQGELRQD
jgi:hypothetical protein